MTGGPGMGKSSAAEWLAGQGVPTVDTDDLARRLVVPGEPALQEIAQTFGSEMVGRDGQLRRGALAEVVFKDASARQKLEAILHPRIHAKWKAQTAKWRETGVEAGVVVIPLLFETGAEEEFQSVICIACSSALQSARLQSRGWNAEQASGRVSAQWPIEKKMDRSQYVIWNESSVAAMREQLGRIPPLKGRDKGLS